MHFSFVFAIIVALTASVSISACPTLCDDTEDCCLFQYCKSVYIPASVSMSGLHPVFLRLTGMILGTIYKHLHFRLNQA